MVLTDRHLAHTYIIYICKDILLTHNDVKMALQKLKSSNVIINWLWVFLQLCVKDLNGIVSLTKTVLVGSTECSYFMEK